MEQTLNCFTAEDSIPDVLMKRHLLQQMPSMVIGMCICYELIKLNRTITCI